MRDSQLSLKVSVLLQNLQSVDYIRNIVQLITAESFSLPILMNLFVCVLFQSCTGYKQKNVQEIKKPIEIKNSFD